MSFFETKKYQKRKVARLISLTEFNHVVIKSGLPVLRAHHNIIKTMIVETQARFGIKLKAISIMSNHCHLIIKAKSRQQFVNALRFLTGMIVLQIKKYLGKKTSFKLWSERAWSRIVHCGKDLAGVVKYVCSNPLREGIYSNTIDSVCILNGVLWLESLIIQEYDSQSAHFQMSFGF